MAGVVYLKTNRFEVKLEGITFKKKNFESLCKIDFLFPDGKTWDQPPIVGLDVMCHPRDPSTILLLLTFGVGCVILRFAAGEALPAPIHRFLADKRIGFVGFGIPEKMELFPFQQLGLSKTQMDIGYIAAKVFKDNKYKHYDLGQLARKVVGIKKMMGLTEGSSFERHAQIKCAICQLFVTSLVAMGLTGVNDNKRLNGSAKKGSSFLKNLNSLQLLAEGWFKLPKSKKRQDADDGRIQARMEDLLDGDGVLVDADIFAGDDTPTDASVDNSPIFKFDGASSDESGKESSPSPPPSPPAIKPIKGILKCPSTTLNRCRSLSSASPSLSPSPLSRSPSMYHASPSSPLSRSPSMYHPSPLSQSPLYPSSPNYLKRANSKGCNVRFNFH